MASILIVDDEYGIAEAVSEALAMLGYDPTTAINGQLGLLAVAQSRPDLILLDVMMPIMSGPDMLRVLKADESTRDIPVIMMSAADSEAIPADAHALIDGFMQKPFTFEDLCALMRRALPIDQP